MAEFRAALRELRTLWKLVDGIPGGTAENSPVAWFRAELMVVQTRLYQQELHCRLAEVEDRIAACRNLTSQSDDDGLLAALERRRSHLLDEIVRTRRDPMAAAAE